MGFTHPLPWPSMVKAICMWPIPGTTGSFDFPRPLDQKEDVKLPDMVVGQTSF